MPLVRVGRLNGHGFSVHARCGLSLAEFLSKLQQALLEDGPMLTAAQNHIRIDDHGKAWIDDTNIKVIEVATDWLAHRSSPEEMHLQYPHLSVAQICAALAHYYDNKDEFDAQIKRSVEEYERLRAEAEAQPSPIREKLRKLGHVK